ncbi:hypothetical protein F511_31026 [Dorcoceras hygrometricum]|uniref:Uncharacterized protein n=1 Tax=Dorcoceras hygrometricum TaxID=472368 RepID=A0A2Z7A5Z9_9LAMI|nr:hypothetical protein F511_31026 [Dorcoceras hygrometricum]
MCRARKVQRYHRSGLVLGLRVLTVVVPLFRERSLLSLRSQLINPSSSSSWLSSLDARGSDLVAISLRRSMVLVLAALVAVVLGQSFVASVEARIRRLRQRQVELFDASGIRVWCIDERVSQVTQLIVELARLEVPQEVVRVSQLFIVSICTGITVGGMSRVMLSLM